MTTREKIETDRLIVRAFLKSDAQDLHEHLSDPRVYLYEAGEPIDLKQTYAYTSDMANKEHFWAVELKSEHKVIHPDNVASWKPLEKFGFRREGLLCKNIYFRKDDAGNPLWWDSYAYARLEEKFEVSTGDSK